MKFFTFKCKNCGNEIKKIKNLKDIFLIKSGRIIECKNCGTKYKVPTPYSKFFSLYNYLLIGGLLPIVLITLTVFLDKLLGHKVANELGIWVWLVAILLYLFTELTLAILLPLQEIKQEEESKNGTK